LGFRNLQLFQTQSLGITLPPSYKQKVCKCCAISKIKRLPFIESRHRAKEHLERVHSDLCGPQKVPFFGGAKYYVTFKNS
jgi:hypothetical protein